MGNERDTRPAQDDRLASNRRRGGEIPPRSLHALRARGDDAPLASGAAGRPRAAVPRGEQKDGRVDDDRDPGRALAAPRRGRLSTDARPAAAPPRADRLTIAIPA